MDQHLLISILLFLGFFLFIISFIYHFSEKFTFPFTVALLIFGFIGQFLNHQLHLDLHLNLSSDLIYFILLPLLLFEAAFRINFHQFKLQFKTITFISTFGLLVSVFVVAVILALALKMSFLNALLFGALISATDPIAVLALFKKLGAPKRLSLLADGESMFNDATGVIAFKLVSAFALAGTAVSGNVLARSFGDFLYVFVGSMIWGAIVGYIVSRIMGKLPEDRLIKTALTLATALFSFVGGEHFFHFSGVISTVVAGIALGNLGKTKISAENIHFIDRFWEVIGFVSVSLVFFFASFNLHLGLVIERIGQIVVVIIAVLLARAISVYVSFFFSNKLPFFKDEPNVPMSWQHIINWGGLRGVIPLVLAYSLPEDFEYREDFLAFTLASLLFTLFVNGLSIKTLLVKLGLHLPKKEETIINEETQIFDIEEARSKLKKLPKGEFDTSVIDEVEKELTASEKSYKKHLFKMVGPKELESSLQLEALNIERKEIARLYELGHINENVYYQFENEIDLQQDALEYPEVYSGRGFEGGRVKTEGPFRKRLAHLRKLVSNFPVFKKLFDISPESEIEQRFTLLHARIETSERVLVYLDELKELMKDKEEMIQAIDKVRKIHVQMIKHNEMHADQMMKQNKKILRKYEKKLVYSLIKESSPILH